MSQFADTNEIVKNRGILLRLENLGKVEKNDKIRQKSLESLDLDQIYFGSMNAWKST